MTPYKKIPAEERRGVLRPVGRGEIIGAMVIMDFDPKAAEDITFRNGTTRKVTRGFLGARSILAVLDKSKPYAVIQRPKKAEAVEK